MPAYTLRDSQPLDITKPVQTRDGRQARIVCTNSKAQSGPLTVLISCFNENREELRSYRQDGYRNSGAFGGGPAFYSCNDLVNVRAKVVRWKVTIDIEKYDINSGRRRSTDPLIAHRGYYLHKTLEDAIKAHTVIMSDKSFKMGAYVTAIAATEVYEDELGDDE